MYKHACKTGLEGVVSKVRDSRYVSGRVNDWVKKTCAERETLAIAGFALDGGKWDGLYLGGYHLIEMLRQSCSVCRIRGRARWRSLPYAC
jgi:ATP-dependent DNA ligase